MILCVLLSIRDVVFFLIRVYWGKDTTEDILQPGSSVILLHVCSLYPRKGEAIDRDVILQGLEHQREDWQLLSLPLPEWFCDAGTSHVTTGHRRAQLWWGRGELIWKDLLSDRDWGEIFLSSLQY